MKENLNRLVTVSLVITILFSSVSFSPAYARENTASSSAPRQGWGAVVVGVATVIAAAPVVISALDIFCSHHVTNLRTSTSSIQTYGQQNYYSSRSTYSYVSPAKTFYVTRDTRMDGVLNSGLNSAIKTKTGIDVLGGSKYFAGKSWSFTTNRSVRYAYSEAKLTRYTFDIRKKCGFWSDTLVLGSTWFIAPENVTAKYAYFY